MSKLANALNLTHDDALVDFDQFAKAAIELLTKPKTFGTTGAAMRNRVSVLAFFRKRAAFTEQGLLTPFGKIAYASHMSGHDGFKASEDRSEKAWFKHVETRPFKISGTQLDCTLKSIIDDNTIPSRVKGAQPTPRQQLSMENRAKVAQRLRKELGFAR